MIVYFVRLSLSTKEHIGSRKHQKFSVSHWFLCERIYLVRSLVASRFGGAYHEQVIVSVLLVKLELFMSYSHIDKS